MTDPWWDLLSEPKALLGPYGGRPPALSSFAPHSMRADFDVVSVAGQFMVLPASPPRSWGEGGQARAHAVFQFLAVRRFECAGLLQPAASDDANHDAPVGRTAEGGLVALPEIFQAGASPSGGVPWRRFTLRQPGFELLIEAGVVLLRVGRQARRSQGWPAGD